MSTRSRLIDLIPGNKPPEHSPAPAEQLLAALVDAEADPIRAALDAHAFAEFALDYDADEKILFAYFQPTARPCLTAPVLSEMQAVQRMLRGIFGERSADRQGDRSGGDRQGGDRPGAAPPLRYLVLGSRAPGVWNLGADLDLVASLIRDRDRAALRRYAHAGCEVAYTNAAGLGFDLPIVSVALVQGDAVGGGFELALSANLIVAERSAKVGLPDILCHLFPGMGAYSFLTRRIAPALAERLIMSGETYGAEQLYAMGVVDVLAADGRGLAAFYDFIGKGGKRYAALRALCRTRRLVHPVTLDEMTRIADLWVEGALELDEAGMKRLLHLAAAQERRSMQRLS